MLDYRSLGSVRSFSQSAHSTAPFSSLIPLLLSLLASFPPGSTNNKSKRCLGESEPTSAPHLSAVVFLLTDLTDLNVFFTLQLTASPLRRPSPLPSRVLTASQYSHCNLNIMDIMLRLR